jgi:hypothetical protein
MQEKYNGINERNLMLESNVSIGREHASYIQDENARLWNIANQLQKNNSILQNNNNLLQNDNTKLRRSVDYLVNKSALLCCNDVHIIQSM